MSSDIASPRSRRFRAYMTEMSFNGAVGLMRLIGPAHASYVGAKLAGFIGPFLSSTRTGMQNLAIAFPDMEDRERRQVVRGAWDNLGRVIGEFSHLRNFARTSSGPGWEIAGEEHIAAAWRNGQPPIFFSAHVGNWEMILPIAGALGLPVGGVYRAASNPIVERLVQGIRHEAGNGTSMFPKGSRGARSIVGHMASGGTVGLLVDQKMNDGIAVPFFGKDAWTAPALAQLAMRFQRDIVPIRVVRLGAARFQLICEPALTITKTGERAADELSIMKLVNAHVERWVAEEPHQWLWFHRRWPKHETTATSR